MNAILSRAARSLAARAILAFLFLLALVTVPLGLRYLDDVEALLSHSAEAQLRSAAELGPLLLDADAVAQVRNLLWQGTPEHTRIVAALAALQRAPGVARAALLRRGAGGAWVYVADGDGRAEINAPAAEPAPVLGALDTLGALGTLGTSWDDARAPSVQRVPYVDGGAYVALAPLRRGAGGANGVAMLLLRGSRAPIVAVVAERRRQLAMGLALALAGGALVWGYLATRALRPLARARTTVDDALRRLAAGEPVAAEPGAESDTVPSPRGEAAPPATEADALARGVTALLLAVGEREAARETAHPPPAPRQAERAAEQALLLEHLDEGVLIVDGSGAVGPTRSAAVARLLGPFAPGDGLPERLGGPGAGAEREARRSRVRETLRAVIGAAPPADWAAATAALPAEVRGAGQIWLRARYRPLLDAAGARVAGLLVLLRDVTVERRLRAGRERQRDRLAAIVPYLRHRERFDAFCAEAGAALESAREACGRMELVRRGVVDEALRTVHTLLGTAERFGLSALATRARAALAHLGTLAAQRDAALPEAERRRLADELRGLREGLEAARAGLARLAGRPGLERTYAADESTLVRVSAELLEAAPAAAERVRGALQRLRRVPTARLLEGYAPYVEALARRQDKRVRLAVEAHDAPELTPELANRLDPVLLNLLRNAVEHGIETRTERARLGKPPLGRIACTAWGREGGIVIGIADDGPGMDLARVRRVAAERGFVPPERVETLSREELLRLLFLPGFCAPEPGRGVGMDVVRTEVERLQGRLRVETQPGRGTLVQVYCPLPA